MDLGHPDEAVKDFDRAITLSPNYGAADKHRGNWPRLGSAQFDPAFQDYRKAVEPMPQSAGADNGRGIASTPSSSVITPRCVTSAAPSR